MVTRAQVGTVKPNPHFNLHTSYISPLPKSPSIILSDPNWCAAMYDEYNALVKNSTWMLVPKLPNTNVVRSMWLFRHKYHADGSLSKYKARLVANGCTQQVGIDCDDIFSPVIKPTTIRTVLSLALSRGWHVHQLDVKNAFLNGDLSETVYMYQPPGFVDSRFLHHVCQLQRSLYGLKQAPHAWFQRFASYALRVGFSFSRRDSSLFIYSHGTQIAYLLIYVDDIILTASSTNLLQCMFLSQKKYALELLDRAYMANCNPTRTPVDTKSKLGSDGVPISDPTLYRSLVGGLQYLTFTRPDISYAVQQVLLLHIPMLIGMVALLPGGLHLVIVFSWEIIYSHGQPSDNILSRSNVEAEYRGVANVVAETVWLRNLLRELHTPLLSATLVYCDNVSVIYMTANPVQHQRTKHIEINIYFVRDMVARGQVRVLHVPYRYLYVDIFTKRLPSTLFEEFCTSGSADRSSISGSANGSLSSGPKPTRDWALPWPVVDRIPFFTKFFVSVLKYFRIHISQLSPFGAARISHFEVLTRVLDLGPSVAVFRAFYTRMYSDGLFSFAKRSLSAPSCLSKPSDSIKNWANHFFWVDSRVFPISIPLYTGGVLEKDPAPHLTARQEQAVQVLSSNKAPFRRYPECFLALVGLSPYYPFGENTYPAFEGPDRKDMGLLDYIRTADPRKCFVSLDATAVAHQAMVVDRGWTLEVSVSGWQKCCIRRESFGGGFSEIKGLECDADSNVHTHVTVQSSRVADAPVYTAADIVTSSRGKTLVLPTSGMDGSSQPETLEESTDSFYETAVLNSEDAKRWYVPVEHNPMISCWMMVFLSFVGVDRGQRGQILFLGRGRGRIEHELELKEKLRVKYDARGVLLWEKDGEIARLKSLVKEKGRQVRGGFRPHVISFLSWLRINPFERRKCHQSALDDSQAACNEAKNLISSLSFERDGLASEVSTLHSAFSDFKEKMEAQQEEQAQELYNRMAELEAHVMDVSGRLEGEFYPAYLTTLAGRRWLLTHGIELAMVKCLKSPEYQGILGGALGRAVDYGMQEGLAAGHKHGVAGTPLSAVVAYNPETAESNYLDAVRAIEEADFPLVHLLKSKKDSGMDEVLDCFLLDGPLADLPEAAHLQPCLEQLSVLIYHADVNAVVGETSLSFALLIVHTRAEGAKRHAAALRQLMVDIVSHPLSSRNLLGEASTSAVAPYVEDLDTDEDLGSVVCMPRFEDPRFEILP
ncbi:ribonuclease H-like domain-containing protein [Tanacetum coccineum]